jgi:hypothetical protein
MVTATLKLCGNLKDSKAFREFAELRSCIMQLFVLISLDLIAIALCPLLADEEVHWRYLNLMAFEGELREHSAKTQERKK